MIGLAGGGTAGQLRFRFQDLREEIQALREVARDFITTQSLLALDQLESDLQSLWSWKEESSRRWELHDTRTVVSEGEYEPAGRQGGRQIVAVVSGTWDVRPMGPNTGKQKQKRVLEFCGIASTRIQLVEADSSDQPIAMWRMEFGDVDSPGCYFHIQVLGDKDEPPFPSSVPVPRLPSIFVTPMGAIEFILGEIFQERWAKVAMESSGRMQRWRGLQKRRLLRLLAWQKELVENSMTSPWIALKMAKPEAGMFLG